ncbi:MAG: hypothetical protein IPM79_29440 [Polyangiaceae bacterium]|nr:hypothetical protein [Polyangiaceae bacterium]MBK8941617.1 hypothetical protein [Polyangiaceae bacterium]
MRLGVIGPSNGDLVALATAAQVLVDHSQVERVLYLGKDDALDRVVQAWATEIVGANPDEAVLFARAAVACVKASAEDIDAFVASERVRRRLRIYATVPAPPGRTVELFDGRIAVFVYDKATLDEDDIAGASVMVFGRSDRPLVHRVGSRTFVAPGSLGSPGGGIVVLDDESEPGIRIEFLDSEGAVVSAERIESRAPRAAGKLKVQGSGS